MGSLLYVAFFCSGASGLIYQVTWVRQFGNVFGNTVHSAALVVAVFMLGLGAGAYAAGRWADRRLAARGASPAAFDGRCIPADGVAPHSNTPSILNRRALSAGRLARLGATRDLHHGLLDDDPRALLRAYVLAEALLAGLGVGLSLLLPHLAAIVARWSHYTIGPDGWQALSSASYGARAATAVVLLTPVTLAMGATLTLLIRHLVWLDLAAGHVRIARLYGANTLGAAAGALLTDFVLVRLAGLQGAQLTAAGLNLVAAALAVAASTSADAPRVPGPPAPAAPGPGGRRVEPAIAAVALAVAMSGFAAMGMEMVWLRHLTILLGGFRAVFSLVLGVLLLATGAGALAGGWMLRWWGRPADGLAAALAVFALGTLAGLAAADGAVLAAHGREVAATLAVLGPARRALAELWFNLVPILFEVALPAFAAGMTFPLANALAQTSSARVGRRAGLIYFANTAGAVGGSLVAGYVLLPGLGMQAAAAMLAAVAAVAILPLLAAGAARAVVTAGVATAGAALAVWIGLPPDFVVRRASPVASGERVLTRSEGMTEVIAVVEAARGRALLTNGHAMSSTAPLDQRYMRALAHVPLLSMTAPRRVLVIGFGVGNTVHAATLHPSVERVDVAELSPHVLAHAAYFRDATHDVLHDPKVTVYLNDGRQHLEMTAAGSYDLVTLEPPPIAHAGVAALYSREFYTLVRSRLTREGFVSQWLPAYQVPVASSLAMVRAFLDVFPQAVLLSGAQAELLLIGTAAPRLEIDPDRVVHGISQSPAVAADLAGVDLGGAREIVGAFVGSSATLAEATRGSPAVTDDRPLQEYGVWSGLSTGLHGVPASLFDLDGVAAWCPRCFERGTPVPAVAGLDAYLGLTREAYAAPVAEVAAAAHSRGARTILGSRYLGLVLPDTAEVYNIVGAEARREGRIEDAARAFEAALRLEPASSAARQNLGRIRHEQGRALLEARRFREAAGELRVAIALLPQSAEAHNDLGVALASVNDVAAAAAQFRAAVALQPDFVEARRNLSVAEALVR